MGSKSSKSKGSSTSAPPNADGSTSLTQKNNTRKVSTRQTIRRADSYKDPNYKSYTLPRCSTLTTDPIELYTAYVLANTNTIDNDPQTPSCDDTSKQHTVTGSLHHAATVSACTSSDGSPDYNNVASSNCDNSHSTSSHTDTYSSSSHHDYSSHSVADYSSHSVVDHSYSGGFDSGGSGFDSNNY